MQRARTGHALVTVIALLRYRTVQQHRTDRGGPVRRLVGGARRIGHVAASVQRGVVRTAGLQAVERGPGQAHLVRAGARLHVVVRGARDVVGRVPVLVVKGHLHRLLLRVRRCHVEDVVGHLLRTGAHIRTLPHVVVNRGRLGHLRLGGVAVKRTASQLTVALRPRHTIR